MAIAVFVVVSLLSGLAFGAGYVSSTPKAKSSASQSSTRSSLPSAPNNADPGSPSTVPSPPGQQSPAPTSPGGTPDWDQVATVIGHGVVNIVSLMDGGVGAGTGMILTADGAILTNNHVVDGASAIEVTVVDSGDRYRAEVTGADPANDVAVLRLEGASGLTPIPLGDADGVKAGDPVAAIGNAGGKGGTPSVTTGKVVALHRSITAMESDGTNAHRLTDMIQVDAELQPGNSGGPLVDANAKVIGVNSAASVGGRRSRAPAREGYAIPIDRALEIAKTLDGGSPSSNPGGPSTTQRSSRGYLGVQTQDGPSGASVVTVQPNSPAAQAGLRAGDVITGFGPDEIASADDLVVAIQQHTAGERVQLSWTTSTGRQQQAEVTLAAR